MEPRGVKSNYFLEDLGRWRFKTTTKTENLVFPSGLSYDKSNDQVWTPKVNAIFGSIPILSKEISNTKKGEPIAVNQFSDLVTLGRISCADQTKLRFENSTNKKTLKQAFLELVYFN